MLDDPYLDTTPRSRRKPIMGDRHPPVLARFGGGGARRDEVEMTPRWRDRKYSDEPRRGDYPDGARDRRGWDRYDDRSLGRRERQSSRNQYDDHSLRRGGRRRSYRDSAYSDDDLTLRRAKGRRQSDSRRKSRRESAYSDDDLPPRRGRGKQSRGDASLGRRRDRKKSGPTHIDDFDEFESDTETDSYSDSDSEFSSDSEGRRRGRLRSSASAAEISNGRWALGEGDQDKIEQRIKNQREEIKRQLAALAELQKTHGVKSLPPDNQKTLQADLQKLEVLQAKRKEKPEDLTSQMQLLGQQMLLCEHLKEAQAHVTSLPASPTRMVPSQSAHSLKIQMLQEQQQILAQQQAQLYIEQQRQLEAEQQRQALLAAEQQMQEAQRRMAIAEHQRQLQMAQLAQYQGQQQLQMHQLAGMPVTYSPYGGALAYF